jgi:large repetitive protein
MCGHVKRLIVFFAALLPAQLLIAQINATVYEGELYGLGVSPVPGESYEWHVFTDYTLTTEADPSVVVFPSGNTGISVPVIWLSGGTYYFTVVATNVNGCSNLKVGMITVISHAVQGPAITIQVDRNPVCAGWRVRFKATPSNQGPYSRFTWYKNGKQVGMDSPGYGDSTLNDNDRVKCVLTTSALRGTGENVSVASNEITITVYNPVAAFKVDADGLMGSGGVRMVNQSTGADLYEWDFGDGTTSGAENPSVTYFEEGIYLIRLVAQKEGMCYDTTAQKFQMSFKGLYIPNAFAPMASGSLPGVFKPAGVGLKRFKIEVYDNWGHLLWQSAELDESGIPTGFWDGTFEGRMMPQDTYMWKAEAEFRDGTVWTGSDNGKGAGRTMGTVTLLR